VIALLIGVQSTKRKLYGNNNCNLIGEILVKYWFPFPSRWGWRNNDCQIHPPSQKQCENQNKGLKRSQIPVENKT
jgi:hypothetical protein